jgi:asparagine synthase (glutamine-hydrolysing)
MMSGITGIFYLDKRKVDRSELNKMISILAHRGVDGSNIWCQENIGLGHLMLRATPESLLEELPLTNESGEFVITIDARIDNRQELISTLQFHKSPPDVITDSDLVLAAYEKWGENCPQYLLGDFAFVIWDKREQKLFCARDHFGIKPFYYYSSSKTFTFASEIKAIFSLSEIPRELNESRIADYLIANFDDKTITSYQDIFRLPPAHQMTVNCKRIEIKPYWSLNPSYELRLGSDEEYAAKFREIFTEAVRCRLRSAYPIGSRLSGGLDSSSITCVARQILKQNNKQPLHTFSLIYDKVTETDERFFINTVVAQGDLVTHYFHGDDFSPLVDIERIMWHEDEAFYAPGLATTWKHYMSVKEEGFRVLLDGHDGDGVVSYGMGYLQELAYTGHWLKLAIEMKAATKNHDEPFWSNYCNYINLYGIKPLTSKFPILKLVQKIRRELQQHFQVMKNSSNNNTSTKLPKWSAIVNPNFLQRMELIRRYKALQKADTELKSEREEHYQTINDGRQVFALEIADKIAAASSLDLRYPFWDKRLVEFCLSLPPEQKLRQGWTRRILRHAMTDILPQEVQWRKNKSNFLPSFSYGLLTFECQRIEELILNDSEIFQKYLNIPSLQEVYDHFVSPKSRKPQDVFSLWTGLSLALWLKFIHLEKPK